MSAAFLHATWNLLAKRANGGPAFTWLFSSLAALAYAPIAAAVMFVRRPHVGPVELAFMAGTGVLHLGYFLALQQGYRVGDLSLVYPLARGTGPLLSTLAAMAVLGERPTPLALAGALLVTAGVFGLAWRPAEAVAPAGAGGPSAAASGKITSARGAVAYGLLTGVLIAAYTLWDAHAVKALFVPPLLQDWASNAGRALLLAPWVLARRDQLSSGWRARRREVLGVAILSPLAYILVLTAMVFSPVSYVAPAREIGILIATAMGTGLLGEGQAPRRLLAATAMVAGVVALVLG